MPTPVTTETGITITASVLRISRRVVDYGFAGSDSNPTELTEITS